MTKILAAAITALTIAGLSSGAFAAPMMAMKPGMHPMMHSHMHKVCKTVWVHHHKKTVCTMVKM
jgi:hypothetical protein